jgi:hypothetical protein
VLVGLGRGKLADEKILGFREGSSVLESGEVRRRARAMDGRRKTIGRKKEACRKWARSKKGRRCVALCLVRPECPISTPDMVGCIGLDGPSALCRAVLWYQYLIYVA